jgi:hypothetical protein
MINIAVPGSDLENPDLTEFVIRVDARRYIEYYHQEIRHHIENRLGDKWRVVSIEQRPETLYKAMDATRADENPVYSVKQILGTLEITAIENGPLERWVDEKFVAIPRRKLRLRAELQDGDEGTFKIVECDVEAPKRSGL